MDNNLSVQNISFSYSNKQILNDISFSCENGVVALLGHNGAGKTTLMNILTGLKKAKMGSVTLNDYNILNFQNASNISIGYLPQNFELYSNITGYDLLSYVCDIRGVNSGKKEHINQLVEKFNLKDVIKKNIGKYSGGYKRRLGIAQAMVGKPNLVIIDEPTVGLDPEQRLEFRQYLSKIGEECITLISTHIIEDVVYSDKVLIMKNGKIIFDGDSNEAIRKASEEINTVEIKIRDLESTRKQINIIEEKRISNETVKLKFIGNEDIIKGAYKAEEVSLENAYVYFQTKESN